MDPNFDACLAVTLAYEGGFNTIRSDPGNWTGGKVGIGALNGTKYGIAASAHPTLDISALTIDQAAAIYRRTYWHPSAAAAQALGLDLTVFDAAVNSGVAQAKRWLARAIGTAQAPAATADAIHAYAEARLSFLHALRSWPAFGSGWGARVAGVEAISVRMLLGTSAAASAIIARKGTAARRKAALARTQSKTAGAGTAIGPVAVHAAGAHHLIVIAITLVGLVAAGALAFTAWRQSQRSAAFTTEATKK